MCGTKRPRPTAQEKAAEAAEKRDRGGDEDEEEGEEGEGEEEAEESTRSKCYCGNTYAPDAVFCRKCGEKRPQPPPTLRRCGCGNEFLGDTR